MISFLLGRRWRDRGRLLFHYYDGRRRRTADPVAVWQRLEGHPQYQHSRDFGPAMAGDEDKQAAAVAAVCDAFAVEPFSDESGRGMTITERLGLLMGFDEYAQQLRAGLGLTAIGRDVSPANTEDQPAVQPEDQLLGAEA